MEWSLGDGTTSSQDVFTHIYNVEGDYTISLTVTDSRGQMDSSFVTIHLTEKRPTAFIDRPAKFTFFEGETIHFRAHATYPGDESTLSYEWDFGDGLTYLGKNAKRAYADDGVYIATFMVRDAQGHEDAVSVHLTILNVDPVAVIIAPSEGEVGATISFEAEAIDPGEDTLTYEWDLGDGSTNSGQSISYVYADPGVYEVALTVRDEDGGMTLVTTTINIYAPEVPQEEEEPEVPTEEEPPEEQPEVPETPDDKPEPKDDPIKPEPQATKDKPPKAKIPIYAILAALLLALGAFGAAIRHWKKNQKRR
jgi:PKD repeat protein